MANGTMKTLGVIASVAIVSVLATIFLMTLISANASEIKVNKVKIEGLTKQLDRIESNQQTLLRDRNLPAAKK